MPHISWMRRHNRYSTSKSSSVYMGARNLIFTNVDTATSYVTISAIIASSGQRSWDWVRIP